LKKASLLDIDETSFVINKLRRVLGWKGWK
jgi:hypothetical protein